MLHRTVMAVASGMAMICAAPAAAKCSLGKMLELPVTMTGLRPLVTVGINGKPAQFIVDSGAFYSAMSAAAASDLGLRTTPAPAGFYMTGVGGRADIAIARVKDFTLGTVPVHNIEFIVGGSDVGQAGLMGQNVLRIGDVEYDFGNGALRFFRPHDCDKTILAYWLKPNQSYSTLPINVMAQQNFQTAATVKINAVSIKAVFDTGAPTTILTTAAAARAGVRPGGPGVVDAGVTGGLGRQVVRTWIGGFQNLTIGDEQIQKIRLRFGAVGDGSFDMLIGADFFLSHRVYVSNALHRMFFSYNGGPVFNLSREYAATGASGAAAADLPVDADAPALARRASSLLSRNDATDAIALLDKAIALAPSEASYRVIRARAYAARRDRARSLADLDKALKLAPDDADALMERAILRLYAIPPKRDGEDDDGKPSQPPLRPDADAKPAARADLDAASAAMGKADGRRQALAGLYEQVDAIDEAVRQYDLWIAAHPADGNLPEALNGRCWARTLAGKQLDLAIADCNRALRLRPHVAAILDSRGLAYLRSGDLDRAIASYDEALTRTPNMAWSLYGRGIAKLRKGAKAAGEADIAAASKVDPGIAALAKSYGVTPP